MPTLKQIIWTVAAGVAISLGATIIGFLSAARLEVSFDKLKDFDVTDLKTYKSLGTSVKFDLQLSQPREFVAFFSELEEGKTVVKESDLHFNNFKLSSRIEGKITDHPKEGDVIYDIIGYYNTDRVVFSHRGPISGVGVYILNSFQLPHVPGEIFAGYAIFEDIIEGTNKTRLTQCPFVMVEQLGSIKPYTTTDDARKAFSLLRTDCTVFNVPDQS